MQIKTFGELSMPRNLVVARTKGARAHSFMALQDLQAEMKKSSFAVDASVEERMVDQVLLLMNDSNTEVKNHAVKTCAFFPLITASCVTNARTASEHSSLASSKRAYSSSSNSSPATPRARTNSYEISPTWVRSVSWLSAASS